MRPTDEKHQALQRAKTLLLSSDELDLRYAALELRRCIEAVVYEKLLAYQGRFPPEVARKWQPPQAFRALLLMEPDAEQTSVIRYARETEFGKKVAEPYQTLGTDLRFSSKWLNNTYNKLGSVLHASWPFAKKQSVSPLSDCKGFLEKTSDELTPYVKKTFTATFAETVSFVCAECGTTVKANANGLRSTGEITCLNPECGCRYTVSIADDQYTFSLEALDAECPRCNQHIKIPEKRIALGYEFTCTGCGGKYSISGQSWSFDYLNAESSP